MEIFNEPYIWLVIGVVATVVLFIWRVLVAIYRIPSEPIESSLEEIQEIATEKYKELSNKNGKIVFDEDKVNIYKDGDKIIRIDGDKKYLLNNGVWEKYE